MRRLGIAIAVLVFGLVSVGAALAATGVGRHAETDPSGPSRTSESMPADAGVGGAAPATLVPQDEERVRAAVRAAPSGGQASPTPRNDAGKSAEKAAGGKVQKPITGAVVHDPDDCDDVCSDATPDADDGVADPTTGVDDDGDSDDCGDVDTGSAAAGGSTGVDDDGDGDGGDCGESGD